MGSKNPSTTMMPFDIDVHSSVRQNNEAAEDSSNYNDVVDLSSVLFQRFSTSSPSMSDNQHDLSSLSATLRFMETLNSTPDLAAAAANLCSSDQDQFVDRYMYTGGAMNDYYNGRWTSSEVGIGSENEVNYGIHGMIDNLRPFGGGGDGEFNKRNCNTNINGGYNQRRSVNSISASSAAGIAGSGTSLWNTATNAMLMMPESEEGRLSSHGIDNMIDANYYSQRPAAQRQSDGVLDLPLASDLSGVSADGRERRHRPHGDAGLSHSSAETSGKETTSTSAAVAAAAAENQQKMAAELLDVECFRQSKDAEDECGEVSQPQRRPSKRSRGPENHNLSEKRRRNRINEKLRNLQKLIPNSTKTDKASILDEVIEYLKTLRLQLQMISSRRGMLTISPTGTISLNGAAADLDLPGTSSLGPSLLQQFSSSVGFTPSPITPASRCISAAAADHLRAISSNNLSVDGANGDAQTAAAIAANDPSAYNRAFEAALKGSSTANLSRLQPQNSARAQQCSSAPNCGTPLSFSQSPPFAEAQMYDDAEHAYLYPHHQELAIGDDISTGFYPDIHTN